MTDHPGPADGPQPLPVVRSRVPRLPAVVEAPLDVAVGAAVVVARPAVAVTASVASSLAPVVSSVWGLVSRPPLVPERPRRVGGAQPVGRPRRRRLMLTGKYLLA